MRSLDDLTSYVYGLLDEPEEAALRSHVADCPACAKQVDRIEAEHRLFEGALARVEPEAPAVEAILERRHPAPVRRGFGLLPCLRVATGAAAALCVALLVGRSGPPPEPPAPAVAAPPSPSRALAYVQDRGLGALVAQDEEGRPVGELGLKSHRVSVEILDGIAKTTVEENFANPTDRRLEGTFHFPLPPDASISRLALEVNGKIEEGTCLERERAREVFEDIVRKMKDPALLEWMPGGIFKCRVFPIEPRSTKRVIVAYTQALPFFRGRMTYVYPLASEKTSVHPPEELRIDLLAKFSGRLTKVESPSHRVDVQRRNDREAAATFAASHVRPRNDFVVSIETADDELRVVPHKTDGEDGYFALFLTPEGAPARKPDRYVFVLDVSASVSAPELEVQKRLVRAMMENRIEGDRFEIVASNVGVEFSGEVDLRAADEFMDRLRPLGGSDLLLGLRSAPEGQIIYVGEGVPTFGETDRAKILEGVKGRRIRTIGVGSRCDVDLLQKLGGHLRVSPSDDVNGRIAEIAGTLGGPVLSDLRVSGGDAIYEVVGLRDLFFGERLVVTGRYRGPAARIVVTGQGYHRELDVTLPPKEEGNNYVRRLWAQRKVSELLAAGESKKREVTELGVKHQIMTPYTSFLVLESEQMWKDYHLKRDVQKPDQVLAKDWIGTQGMEIAARTTLRRMEGKTPAERGAIAQAFSRFIHEYASPDPDSASDYLRIWKQVNEKAIPAGSGGAGGAPAPGATAEMVARELEVLRNLLDDVGVDIINRANPTPAPPSAGPTIPGFSRFTLVSNGAEQSIDLPRISQPPLTPSMFIPPGEEVLSYAEARTTSNQFGGLEFTLGEAARNRVLVKRPAVPVVSDIPVLNYLFEPPAPIVPDPAPRGEDLKGAETKVLPLKYLQPPLTYQSNLVANKLISGQPVQPAFPKEEILRRFELYQTLRSLLTRDAEGRVLGRLDFDPQTNVFIVRDTPAVQARVAAALARLDVEPGQVMLDIKIISTTNPDLLKFGSTWSFGGTDGVGVSSRVLQPSTFTTPDAAVDKPSRLPFGLGREPRGQAFLSADETAMLLRAFKQDRQSRLIQEPTLAVMDNTEAQVFAGETISHAGDSTLFGFLLVLVPKIVPDADKVILTIMPVSGGSTSSGLVTRLVMESGRTAILGGLTLDRSAAGPKPPGGSTAPEHLVIFVTPRIVKPRSDPSSALQSMLKSREEQEASEALQAKLKSREEQEGKGAGKGDVSSVLSTNGTSTEAVVGVGARSGVQVGQLFAIARDGRFVGVVRILETWDDRARGEVWSGLALGRLLPGDRAEPIGDLSGYLADLPADVRLELASRASVEAIRSKMSLKE